MKAGSRHLFPARFHGAYIGNWKRLLDSGMDNRNSVFPQNNGLFLET